MNLIEFENIDLLYTVKPYRNNNRERRFKMLLNGFQYIMYDRKILVPKIELFTRFIQFIKHFLILDQRFFH